MMKCMECTPPHGPLGYVVLVLWRQTERKQTVFVLPAGSPHSAAAVQLIRKLRSTHTTLALKEKCGVNQPIARPQNKTMLTKWGIAK